MRSRLLIRYFLARSLPALLLVGCSAESGLGELIPQPASHALGIDAGVGSEGIWTEVDPMTEGRAYHTATVLDSGEVLAVGGVTSSMVDLASAELYSPAKNEWSAAATMVTPRSKHTATLLSNGTVLVTGGTTMGTAVKTAELYDRLGDKWSSAGSMVKRRYSHTATLLMNGKVLVVGGLNGNGAPIADVELYNYEDNTWATTSSMSKPRAYHAAARLADGSVLVAGGSAPEYLDSAEIYNEDAGTWLVVDSMQAKRSSPTATTLAGCDALDCKVLVTGSFQDGSETAEIYDSVKNTWSLTGLMETKRFSHVATLLNDDRVFVAGGATPNDPALSSAEVYDPKTTTWSSAGSLSTGRSLPALALLPEWKVLITGGGSPTGSLASADLYTPPPAPVGALCNASAQCQSGSCVAGTCGCVSRSDCEMELICDMAGRCTFPLLSGVSCASPAQCQSGLCNEGACGKLGGEACAGSGECRSGSCTEGVCACASVHDCAPGLVCDLSQRCAPPPPHSDGGCGIVSRPPAGGVPGWGVGVLLLVAGARVSRRRASRRHAAR